ncbi:MAG: hypothetical protein SGPRY_006953 [Prymnesium sp.]
MKERDALHSELERMRAEGRRTELAASRSRAQAMQMSDIGERLAECEAELARSEEARRHAEGVSEEVEGRALQARAVRVDRLRSGN